MPPEAQRPTDFDAGKIATTVNKHDADFVDIKRRLKALEDKLGTNEKIADTLCVVDEKASKFAEMLERRINKLLQVDGVARKQVKHIVSEELKITWKAFFISTGGKLLFALWTLGVLAVGAWLENLWK